MSSIADIKLFFEMIGAVGGAFVAIFAAVRYGRRLLSRFSRIARGVIIGVSVIIIGAVFAMLALNSVSAWRSSSRSIELGNNADGHPDTQAIWLGSSVQVSRQAPAIDMERFCQVVFWRTDRQPNSDGISVGQTATAGQIRLHLGQDVAVTELDDSGRARQTFLVRYNGTRGNPSRCWIEISRRGWF